MKSSYILGCGLSLLLLAGCASDNFPFNFFGGNTRFVAENTNPEGDKTRTIVSEPGTGEIQIHWTPGDKIGVFGTKTTKNSEFMSNISESQATAIFEGDLERGEDILAVYYPHSATAGDDHTSLSGILPLEQKFDTSTKEIEGDYKIGIRIGEGTYKFDHLFSFLKFDVDASGTELADDKLQSIELTIGNEENPVNLGGEFTFHAGDGNPTFIEGLKNNKLTMTWSDTPAMSEHFTGYMSVAPVNIEGKDITVAITTDRHIGSVTIKPDATVANTGLTSLEGNKYYTIPLNIQNFKDRAEDYAWVCYEIESEDSKLAKERYLDAIANGTYLDCANRVYSTPGNSFMHKINNGFFETPVKVTGLPTGLIWNDERQLVEGKAPAIAGDYYYLVSWTDEYDGTTYNEGVKLTVSSNLHQATPHMGWQSWNVLERNIDEASIKEVADAMVSTGLRDAGYKWLGIDDCWQDTSGVRDEEGMPEVNATKFPNGLKSVTDYLHGSGLKAGIYSDAGTVTCASGANYPSDSNTLLGAYGYEDIHAKKFTEWGFDKLKEDWFWDGHGDKDEIGKKVLTYSDVSTAIDLYTRMGTAIKKYGDKILLSMCQWGVNKPWEWAAETGASSWRISYDHRDCWMGCKNDNVSIPNDATLFDDINGEHNGIGLYNTLYLMRDLWPYAGVNRFNDPDMLVVGIRGKGKSSSDRVYGTAGLTDDETITEFAMWCMWSAPLLITLDVRDWNSVEKKDRDLLMNKDLIDLDQDPLGQQAEFIKANEKDGKLWYFCKDLADGGCAIAVVNLNNSNMDYTINYDDFQALNTTGKSFGWKKLKLTEAGASSTGTIHNTATGKEISGSLAPHATAVYRFTPE